MINNILEETYVFEDINPTEALKRTTHMAIGAHPDDLEIMAYNGIEECYNRKNMHFSGCVVTNGSNSARNDIYKNYSNKEMIAVRKTEQIEAAKIGKYNALTLFGYSSKEVKDKDNDALVIKLSELISIANPEIIYTHNLADKHSTHVAVSIKVIKAIRQLPLDKRPSKVLGCEIWRDLDWVNDEEKIYLDVSDKPNLSQSLLKVFDSQISGGKRYDLATKGRQLANATYSSSHSVDEMKSITYAIDLTPLIEDPNMDISDYITSYIDRFKEDVQIGIRQYI
ncbi:PIG-L family deacetylase [Mycoplasmatota bacterium WC30]